MPKKQCKKLLSFETREDAVQHKIRIQLEEKAFGAHSANATWLNLIPYECVEHRCWHLGRMKYKRLTKLWRALVKVGIPIPFNYKTSDDREILWEKPKITWVPCL